MAFDEDKKIERVNVLCLTAQGVCHTSLAAKYILSFDDVKTNCAFVSNLCKRAGCDAGKFCIEASKSCNGEDFGENCDKSLKECERVLKEKARKVFTDKGVKIPDELKDLTKTQKRDNSYIG